MSEKISLLDFAKNKENPFLKEAVEQIQQSIVKKYKNTSGTSRNATVSYTHLTLPTSDLV